MYYRLEFNWYIKINYYTIFIITNDKFCINKIVNINMYPYDFKKVRYWAGLIKEFNHLLLFNKYNHLNH